MRYVLLLVLLGVVVGCAEERARGGSGGGGNDGSDDAADQGTATDAGDAGWVPPRVTDLSDCGEPSFAGKVLTWIPCKDPLLLGDGRYKCLRDGQIMGCLTHDQCSEWAAANNGTCVLP